MSTSEAAQQAERPYPPCIFKKTSEKRLYQRLRDIYEQHGHTWDNESLDAWPSVVEYASLAPSTILKVTSHSIAKHMNEKNVTWAHVVVLRVIFKSMLFKSKKTIKTIMTKYPSANFHTYAFSEDYKLHSVPAKEDEEDSGGSKVQGGVEEKADDAPGPRKESKPNSTTQRREEDQGEPKSSVTVKLEARDKSPTVGVLNIPQHPGSSVKAPSKKRKRAVTGDEEQVQQPVSEAKGAPKAKKPARSSGNSAAGSKATAKSPVMKSEGLPPQKSEAPLVKVETVPPAKRLRLRKDASKPAPASGLRVENPLKEMEKRLEEQDASLRDLKQLAATQGAHIKSLQKRTKELEQRLQPVGKKPQKHGVKESMEKAT